MSTTDQTVQINSYGVALPEPTENQKRAVALFDNKLSDSDAAAQYGAKVGGYNNQKVEGLKRMGRYEEVRASTGSPRGRKAKVVSPQDAIKAQVETLTERAATLRQTISDNAEVQVDDDVVIEAERTRLAGVIEAATVALDGIKGNSKDAQANRAALIDAAKERAASQVDNKRKAAEMQLTEVENALAEWAALLPADA